MTEVENVTLYAALLKDKNRKTGSEILDCFHLADSLNRTEKTIKEYVKRRIKEEPSQFSIGDVLTENVVVYLVELANIQKGDLTGIEIMP